MRARPALRPCERLWSRRIGRLEGESILSTPSAETAESLKTGEICAKIEPHDIIADPLRNAGDSPHWDSKVKEEARDLHEAFDNQKHPS